MDNATHALIGYALYAASKSQVQENHKKWYAGAAILGTEIPDIEAFTMLWGNDVYLIWHRNFTHSILFTPIMALLAIGILSIFSRKRNISWKRMYFLALGGVTSHWLFDYFNQWGTGLFEPFLQERYSLGILPIVDMVLLVIFALGFVLRRKKGSRKAFRAVWAMIFLYLIIQGGQNLWIRQEIAPYYEQHVVSADFIPGQFHVIGKSGEKVEIYQRSLFAEGKKTILKGINDPSIISSVLQDEEAKAIAWFSPFYLVMVEEDGPQERAILLDPRFYRNGSSFLRKEVILEKNYVN